MRMLLEQTKAADSELLRAQNNSSAMLIRAGLIYQPLGSTDRAWLFRPEMIAKDEAYFGRSFSYSWRFPCIVPSRLSSRTANQRQHIRNRRI